MPELPDLRGRYLGVGRVDGQLIHRHGEEFYSHGRVILGSELWEFIRPSHLRGEGAIQGIFKFEEEERSITGEVGLG